ncbi:hypothetical protein, partial [Mammaliicoccus stepanovicii]
KRRYNRFYIDDAGPYEFKDDEVNIEKEN